MTSKTSGQRTRDEAEKRTEAFKRAALGRVQELLEAPTAVVVQELFEHLSIDPKTQTQIVSHWMQPFCLGAGASLQDDLEQKIFLLLTLHMHVEVKSQDHNDVKGTLYLFGAENTAFGIPFDLLRSNYIASVCILRLMRQGHSFGGEFAFGKTLPVQDNTLVHWSEFQMNNSATHCLSRSPFVTAIVMSLVATAIRADNMPTSKDRGCTRAIRTLIAASLTAVVARISKPGVRKNRSWLTDRLIADIVELRSAVNPDNKAFIGLLKRARIEQYRRACAQPVN